MPVTRLSNQRLYSVQQTASSASGGTSVNDENRDANRISTVQGKGSTFAESGTTKTGHPSAMTSRRNILGDVSNHLSIASIAAPSLKQRDVSAVPVGGADEFVQKQSQLALLPVDEETEEDLDAEDIGDPSMVSEYVQDIFVYLRSIEAKNMPDPGYISRQEEITWKMRSVLIDWLVEINSKMKLLPETLFLAVHLMDKFLSIRAVSLAKFQLVGISATLIAAKYEEIMSPAVSNFVYLSDSSYDNEEILKAECYMLNSLQFNLSYPNPYVFLRRISKADNYDLHTRTLAKYFLESSLLDPVFIKYPSSLLAAASIYLSRKMIHRTDWSATLAQFSGYTSSDLYGCIKDFILFFQKPTKYETIYKKYASRKFMKVSVFVKEYMAKYYPATTTTDVSNTAQQP